MTGPARNLLEFCQLAPSIPAPLGPIEVTLATFRRPAQLGKPDLFLEGAARVGVKVELIHEKNAFDLRTLSRMRALLDRVRPDILQTHNVKSNFLAWLSGLGRQYPWIAWNHGYTQPTKKQEIYNRFDRVSLRRARRVVTVTSAFVPGLRASGVPDSRIEIIANAIPLEWMKSAGEPEHRPLPQSGAITLLSIGRLSREKAHSDLLEAAALVQRESGRQVKVLLLGEGHEQNSLVAQAAALGVELTLPGLKEDVRPWYSKGDMFVLPSHSEGSPNVLLEAMALGVPIVSTDVGGVRDILRDGQEALLTPARSPRALADAIAKLIADPAQGARLAAAARERAHRELLPQPRAEKIARLYRKVLEGGA